MSQAPYQTVNFENLPQEWMGPGAADNYRYPPGWFSAAQDQATKGLSNFADSSGPIFDMYLNLAKEEDEKMADSWKADADGILVFTGLFSAAVAALVAVSIQDLRPSSQDTSAFYLQNIYQLIASGNISQLPNIPSSLAIPPAFSPPKYAIWVNSLWFLSLVISITCGLLATLLQQWARRYVKGTQPRYSPHKRARIRAFFAEGVDSLHLPWAVEALPTMLHLSLFLFFAGLVIFLFNVHHTVFTVVSCWVGFCTGVYGCITLMPLFRNDSPYYAPLSSTTWYFVTGISFLLFRILPWPAYYCMGHDAVERFRELKEHYRRLFLNGMGKAAEETALKLGSEIDGRALIWTLDSLDEDRELEQFLAGIPGFFRSTVVKKPEDAFTTTGGKKMSDTLFGLMRRTWSSSLIHESVKQRRIVICKEVMGAAYLPISWDIIRFAFEGERHGLTLSGLVGFGLLLKKTTYDNRIIAHHSKWMVSKIIAGPQEQDDRWFELATAQLGISRSTIEDYLANENNMPLANLVHVTRDMFEYSCSNFHWLPSEARSLLEFISSQFDIQSTLPGLQHDFCDLWNQIVQKALHAEHRLIQLNLIEILCCLHRLYITLHSATDHDHAPPAPEFIQGDYTALKDISLYPLCKSPRHHSNSTH